MRIVPLGHELSLMESIVLLPRSSLKVGAMKVVLDEPPICVSSCILTSRPIPTEITRIPSLRSSSAMSPGSSTSSPGIVDVLFVSVCYKLLEFTRIYINQLIESHSPIFPFFNISNPTVFRS